MHGIFLDLPVASSGVANFCLYWWSFLSLSFSLVVACVPQAFNHLLCSETSGAQFPAGYHFSAQTSTSNYHGSQVEFSLWLNQWLCPLGSIKVTPTCVYWNPTSSQATPTGGHWNHAHLVLWRATSLTGHLGLHLLHEAFIMCYLPPLLCWRESTLSQAWSSQKQQRPTWHGSKKEATVRLEVSLDLKEGHSDPHHRTGGSYSWSPWKTVSPYLPLYSLLSYRLFLWPFI